MSGYFLTCPATFNKDYDFKATDLVDVVDSLVTGFLRVRWDEGISTEDLMDIKIGGLGCLFSTFMLTLSSTKNKEAAVHHAKKALLYYAEFIAQIKQDANSFLKLTATDAVLFSYKKTIFTLNRSLQCPLSEREEAMSKVLYGYIQAITAYIEVLIRRGWDCPTVQMASELGRIGLGRAGWSLQDFVSCRNSIVRCANKMEDAEELRNIVLLNITHT